MVIAWVGRLALRHKHVMRHAYSRSAELPLPKVERTYRGGASGYSRRVVPYVFYLGCGRPPLRTFGEGTLLLCLCHLTGECKDEWCHEDGFVCLPLHACRHRVHMRA